MLMIFWEFKPGIGQQVTATYCEEPQKGDKKLEAPLAQTSKRGRAVKVNFDPQNLNRTVK